MKGMLLNNSDRSIDKKSEDTLSARKGGKQGGGKSKDSRGMRKDILPVTVHGRELILETVVMLCKTNFQRFVQRTNMAATMIACSQPGGEGISGLLKIMHSYEYITVSPLCSTLSTLQLLVSMTDKTCIICSRYIDKPNEKLLVDGKSKFNWRNMKDWGC